MSHPGKNWRLPDLAGNVAACRRGVAMYEFAITLPVLIFIIAGGWELARGLWAYELLNKGVRDASRYVARMQDPNSAEAQTQAFRLVLSGDVDLDQPPRLDHNKVTVTVGTRQYANDGAGGAFQYRGPGGSTAPINVVQVRADYAFDVPLLGFFGIASPLTLSAAHEQRHIVD